MADTTQADVAEIDTVASMNDRKPGRDVLDRPAGYVVPADERQPIITDWLPPEENGGKVDWANAPRSYEEWYRQYLPEAKHWVIKSGVNYREVDDVVNELMTRFMERDSLGVFRREWTSRSASGKSNFRSYFSQFVVGYSSGKHRNNVRYATRNVLILNAPVSEDGMTWQELHAPAHYDGADTSVEFAEVVRDVRRKIGDDELVDAVFILATEGAVRQNGLAQRLGRPPREAKSGLAAVRAALAEAMADAE